VALSAHANPARTDSELTGGEFRDQALPSMLIAKGL
jgi:hypothetical protein